MPAMEGTIGGKAFIYVRVSTTDDKDYPTVVFATTVKFKQEVILVRSPHATVAGTTWFNPIIVQPGQTPLSQQEDRSGDNSDGRENICDN